MQRERKDKRYKCGNSNRQWFPTVKGPQHQGTNSQSQPTLPQKPHVSLMSPLLCHRNIHKGIHSGICLPLFVWTYHHSTEAVEPKLHTFKPHPSNLHTYHLNPSIISEKYLFCAFMDVVKNYSALRACAFKYNIHSRITNKLPDEYESHKLSRTRQENEPLVDTNNQNKITTYSQERLDVNHNNQLCTDWGLLTVRQI